MNEVQPKHEQKLTQISFAAQTAHFINDSQGRSAQDSVEVAAAQSGHVLRSFKGYNTHSQQQTRDSFEQLHTMIQEHESEGFLEKIQN